MRAHRVVSAFLVLAVSLAACSGGDGGEDASTSPAAVTSGGDLVIARAVDSTTMNKEIAVDNPSIWVLQQIMEPLFTVAPDGQSVEPWLAASYEVSEDQRTYTVALKPGITFSNGDPMTSEDVKFSIDQARANKKGFGYLDAAIDEISAPDPETVVIHTKYPWAPLLADLALFTNAIIPLDYGGETAEEFYKHPVGTGPFVWDHWTKGQELKLVKNPNYWQEGKPYLDSVTWTVVNDANTRQLQIEGGQAHIDELPPFSAIDQMQADPDLQVELFPSTRTDYLLLNQAYEPLADVHVRRAISFAIDREALIAAVQFGNGEPANSILNPAIPYYDESSPGIEFDAAQAEQEMGMSAYPDGFDLELLIDGGDPSQKSQAEVMQDELQPLGIDVSIRTSADPFGEISAGKYEASFAFWTMDIADPDQIISFAVDPSIANSFFTGYDNPEVVAWAKEAQRTVDEEARRELYSKIQAQTAEDAFLAFLFYLPLPYAMSDSVQGFAVYPTGNYHLEDVSLAP